MEFVNISSGFKAFVEDLRTAATETMTHLARRFGYILVTPTITLVRSLFRGKQIPNFSSQFICTLEQILVFP